MTKDDYDFFQDYADAFRRRHNYTGHRTVFLRHQTQEAAMVLCSLLLSFPKRAQTLGRLHEFAATMGALKVQHLTGVRTERERILGRLWAELAVDAAVLARIYAMCRAHRAQ